MIGMTPKIEKKLTKVEVANFNGIPQYQEVPVIELSCPICGQPIFQANNYEQLAQFYTYEEITRFCPNCGQKIILERGEIIDNG